MKKNKIKFIGNILTLASVCYLIHFFRTLEIDFGLLLDCRMLFVILAGSLLSFSIVLLSALAWKNTIVFFSEKKVSFHAAAVVYLQANLGKYLPGNIAHFVERSIFAAKFGIGQAQTLMGTFLEITGLLFTSVALGMVFSFDDVCRIVRLICSVKYVIGIVLLGFSGMLGLWFLYQKVLWMHSFLEKIRMAGFWKLFFGNVCIYMTTLLLLACLMCVLTGIITETWLTPEQIRGIVNAYVLSWAAGFLMPGAPGGIGVREFVLMYLTRNQSIQESVLLAMIVHRITTVFGDVWGYVWAKVTERKEESDECEVSNR